MRYAIVSDIHANLQAWNAVMLDIRSSSIDRIICLGDIVGYGPSPAEVMKSVYANVNHFILGNHDAVICGKMDADLFNDDARDIILWTRDQLSRDAVRFLAKLPLTLDGGIFRCAHSDFSEPGMFDYVIEPEDALPSWQAVREQLLFVGHTHVPGIYLLGQSGTPHLVPAQDFELEDSKRYLVNVGSVGQPRDGETRAAYCIYDTDRHSVCWRRIPFDIDAYRDTLTAAGISANPSYFLRFDPRRATPPLRNMLTFSPAATQQQAVRDTVAVQDLAVLQKRVTQWKILTACAILVCLVIAAAVGGAWHHRATRRKTLRATVFAPVSAPSSQRDINLLRAPQAPSPPDEPVDGWEYTLGDKRSQTIHVEHLVDRLRGDTFAFALSSGNAAHPLVLSSPPIRVEPGMKVHASALLRPDEGFSGSVKLSLTLFKEEGGKRRALENFVLKEPTEKRNPDYQLVRRTTDPLPAGSVEIQYHLVGNFTGRILVREATLTRR